MTDAFNAPSGSTPTGWTRWDFSWPGSASRDETHALLSFLEERFGIPEAGFDSFLLFKRNRSWWLMRDSSHLEKARHLKVSAVGLKAFEKVGAFVKPTTRFIQLFGNRATKGKLEISEEQLETLKDGGALSVDTRAENGYLILSTHGNVIGLGLLIDGELRSQLPRR